MDVRNFNLFHMSIAWKRLLIDAISLQALPVVCPRFRQSFAIAIVYDSR